MACLSKCSRIGHGQGLRLPSALSSDFLLALPRTPCKPRNPTPNPGPACGCRVSAVPPEEREQSPSGDWFVRSSRMRGLLPEILEEILAARKRCGQQQQQQQLEQLFSACTTRLQHAATHPRPDFHMYLGMYDACAHALVRLAGPRTT